jgi:predicted RND superfamily exporter protein
MRFFKAHIKLQPLVVGFFSSLSLHAIRHPKRVIVIAALITLAAAPGMLRLKLRTDGHALVSQNAPEVIYDKNIRDQFGIEDQMVVLIRSGHADGIFNPATLQLVRDLTAEFRTIPGINPSNVMSLATEPSFRLRPGTLIHETLLEPPLKSKVELNQLRDDLRRIELYTGTFVSADGKSTVILIGVPAGGDRTSLYEKVLNLITAKQSAPEDIAVTGATVAESLLGIHILEDLGVPKALLGTSTRTRTEQLNWKVPSSFYEFRLLIARRIGLVPVAALVMMLIFYLSFRNVLAMLLPLPGFVAAILFVFGLMGWFGVPIYLTTAVMPVLLTAICVTNDIYVFNRYFTLLREKPRVSHVELVRETFDKMVPPVASTSLTSGIGFLSFGFSPLGPVQAFGIFTGIGVLFGLFFSLTVLPAMLTLINPAWLLSRPRREGPIAPSALAAGFVRLGLGAVRWRWWVAGLALLITAITPLGLHRLVVQDSWTDAFDPGSEFRRATQLVNEQFYGMHLLFVCFDAPEVLKGEIPASAITPGRIVLPGELVADPALLPGSSISIFPAEELPGASPTDAPPHAVWQTHIETAARLENNIIVHTPRGAADAAACQSLSRALRLRFEVAGQSHLKPEIIRTIGDLETFIRERRQYAVGGVLGPADYLVTTRFMARPNDPDARVLPDGANETKLLWDFYRIAIGPHRLHQVVDADFSRSLMTVFLKNANFVDTGKLMSDIRTYEHEHLTPKGIRLGFAGDVALSQSLIRGIVTTQLQSLFWSLAGIYVVTAMFGGSLRWGIYCVLPSLLAVLIKFAVMGWLGIPLGVATSMFAAMTLGIGVNCAIHLLEGYRQARAAGASQPAALSRSMGLTGPPALINTVAVSLGFGVLMLSQVPANARLGFLLVVGLVNCFIVSLLLLPVLLHWWPLKDARESKTVLSRN